jgi:hypothetical protein
MVVKLQRAKNNLRKERKSKKERKKIELMIKIIIT